MQNKEIRWERLPRGMRKSISRRGYAGADEELTLEKTPTTVFRDNWLTNVAGPTSSGEKKWDRHFCLSPRYFRSSRFRPRVGLGSTDEWGLCAGPRRCRTRR